MYTTVYEDIHPELRAASIQAILRTAEFKKNGYVVNRQSECFPVQIVLTQLSTTIPTWTNSA